jgi:hypothetical protein
MVNYMKKNKKIFITLNLIFSLMIIPKQAKADLYISNDDYNGTYNKPEEIEGTNLFKIAYPAKIGLISDTGKILLKPQYDSIRSFDFRVFTGNSNNWTEVKNKFFIITDSKKQGLADATGKIIFPMGDWDFDSIIPNLDNYLIIFKKNDKYGLANKTGRILLKPVYDKIGQDDSDYNNDYISFEKNGRVGLLSSTGKIIFQPIYENISYFGSKDNPLFFVTPKGITGIADNNGRLLVTPRFEKYQIFNNLNLKGEFASVKEKGKWGIVDSMSKFLLKPEYEDIDYFVEGNLIEYKEKGKWGLKTFEGKVITPPQFDSFGFPFPHDKIQHCFGDITEKKQENADDKLFPVSNNGKYGFINRQGELVILPKYDYVYNFYQGLGYVSIRDNQAREKQGYKRDTYGVYDGNFHKDSSAYDKWGVIDTKGNWIIKPEFNFIKEFSDGLAFALKEGKGGFIDKTGNFVIPPKYDNPGMGEYCQGYFSNGFSEVNRDGKYFIIDKTGKEFFQYMYSWSMEGASDFSPPSINRFKMERTDFSDLSKVMFNDVSPPIDGIFIVNYGGWYGLADQTGKLIFKPELNNLFPNFLFGKNNYISVGKDGKQAIMDLKGNYLLPPVYDQIESSDEKFFKVSLNGKYGLLDKNFREILPPAFYQLGKFSNGLLTAFKENEKGGLIELSGKFVLPPVFEDVKAFSGNAAWVKQYGLWKLVDKYNNIISGAYPNVDEIINHNAIFSTGITYSVTNKKGKLILDKIRDVSIFNSYNEPNVVLKIKTDSGYFLLDKNGKKTINKPFQEITDYYYVKENNLWGRMDNHFNFSIKPVFEDLIPLNDDETQGALAKISGKWGIIDGKGHFVVKAVYDEINNNFNNFLIVKINGKEELINKAGKSIIETDFEKIEYFNDDYFKVKQSGKWGLIDKQNNFIFKPQFDTVDYRDGDTDRSYSGDNKPDVKKDIYKVTLNGKTGYVTGAGKVLIEPVIETERYYGNGFKIFSINDKYGLMDKNLKTIMEPKFDLIATVPGSYPVFYRDDLAKANINGKVGVIDYNGKMIIEPKYDWVGPFIKGTAMISLNKKLGFVDSSGKEFIPPKYSNLEEFSGDLAKVSVDGKWGYINKFGKEIVKPQYDYIRQFIDGYAVAALNGKEGIIDLNGKPITGFKYDSFYSGRLTDGMYIVESSNLWGFIDKNGKEIIKPEYNMVSEFNEGLASVQIGNTWGFIDKKGKLIIKNIYDETIGFSDGLCAVRRGNKWGYIDHKGKIVLDFIYDQAYPFNNGKAHVSIGDEYVIDKKGKRVKEPDSP